MGIFRQTGALFRKEFRLEWRQRYALGGMLLYVLSTVFIVYVAVQRVTPQLWNVLYWVILLFAAVNAVVKSFVQESGARQLYYYQLAHPVAVLLSKILYNTCLLLALGGLTFLALVFVAGNPVQEAGSFCLALLLGSIGLSIALTFVSAIAAKADNSSTLLAILSFPAILPMLLVLVNLSAHAVGLLGGSMAGKDILLLLSVDMILMAMSLLLFPFLWRD